MSITLLLYLMCVDPTPTTTTTTRSDVLVLHILSIDSIAEYWYQFVHHQFQLPLKRQVCELFQHSTTCGHDPMRLCCMPRRSRSDVSALALATLVSVLITCASILPTRVAGDDSTNGEEPSKPVCRLIPKNSLAFCSMVDYVAVVDEDDPDGAKFDAKAKFYYENADVVLQRFGCHARYSLYKCDDCRDAYKYWICSIKFQKCGLSSSSSSEGDDTTRPGGHGSRICDSSDEKCASGSTGRHRTCLSLCEDVVRKCPYVLNFQCPTVRLRAALSFWSCCLCGGWLLACFR